MKLIDADRLIGALHDCTFIEGDDREIVYTVIQKQPSAEVGTQMSSADLISRQEAIDAIVAWTVEDRPDIEMPTDLVDRVNALPSADASLMQDRCKIDASSDLISRQDAIDALSRGSGCGNSCRRAIKALPSADRKGKWVPSHIPESTLYECDQCGFDCGAYSFSYCPNCGADMRGET